MANGTIVRGICQSIMHPFSVFLRTKWGRMHDLLLQGDQKMFLVLRWAWQHFIKQIGLRCCVRLAFTLSSHLCSHSFSISIFSCSCDEAATVGRHPHCPCRVWSLCRPSGWLGQTVLWREIGRSRPETNTGPGELYARSQGQKSTGHLIQSSADQHVASPFSIHGLFVRSRSL